MRDRWRFEPRLVRGPPRRKLPPSAAKLDPLPARSHPGAEEDQEECRIPKEIPAPQPPRLLRQPVQPFQSQPGHPAGRAPDPPGREVEPRADRYRDRRGKSVPVAMDPQLLFRRSEAPQDELGMRFADPGDRRLRVRARPTVRGYPRRV